MDMVDSQYAAFNKITKSSRCLIANNGLVKSCYDKHGGFMFVCHNALRSLEGFQKHAL